MINKIVISPAKFIEIKKEKFQIKKILYKKESINTVWIKNKIKN